MKRSVGFKLGVNTNIITEIRTNKVK